METVDTGMENREATGTETQDMEDTGVTGNVPGIMGALAGGDTRITM